MEVHLLLVLVFFLLFILSSIAVTLRSGILWTVWITVGACLFFSLVTTFLFVCCLCNGCMFLTYNACFFMTSAIFIGLKITKVLTMPWYLIFIPLLTFMVTFLLVLPCCIENFRRTTRWTFSTTSLTCTFVVLLAFYLEHKVVYPLLIWVFFPVYVLLFFMVLYTLICLCKFNPHERYSDIDLMAPLLAQ